MDHDSARRAGKPPRSRRGGCNLGRDTKFRGVQATAICGLFGLAVASTGASEKSLRRAGMTDYEKVYLHPGNHASYFPGAKPINIKLIFWSE